ncbi:uncharacterized protein WCC33_000979 [Rhinophrynus dorsalis]
MTAEVTEAPSTESAISRNTATLASLTNTEPTVDYYSNYSFNNSIRNYSNKSFSSINFQSNNILFLTSAVITVSPTTIARTPTTEYATTTVAPGATAGAAATAASTEEQSTIATETATSTPTTDTRTTAVTTPPTPVNFNLSLILTDITFTSLGSEDSSTFNNTRILMINLLDIVMKNTSLWSSYTGCQIMGFSSASSGNNTKVDAVCTYIQKSSSPEFDRVGLYKELSNQTNGITKLGKYNLDPRSLYVNGKLEQIHLTTAKVHIFYKQRPGFHCS